MVALPRLASWLVAAATQAGVEHAIEGRWLAEARLGQEAMELVLDVEPCGEELCARISVPAERVLGLEVEALRYAGGELTFRIPHPDHPMSFTGLVAPDNLDGELAVGDGVLALVFRRSGPVPAPPYSELEVGFPGAGRTVRGSLLLPPGDGPHAALALFHTTSGGRRDDMRFYADLAARHGLAALIYDRRTVPIDLAWLTRADFLAVVADAEAAFRALRAHERIDPARVGVGGLSQGAWISAIVATRAPEVAFVLALSPPGVPLHEIDLYQATQRIVALGARGDDVVRTRELLLDLFAASRGEARDRAALEERLERARQTPWAAALALPDRVPPAGSSGALLRWSAHDLDPAHFFSRLRVPIFLAFGERDERLPAEACAARLTEHLARAGNTAVRLQLYPGANHALLPARELEAHLSEWLRSR